ncbi:DcaP family trimeric outer membrane transporter [uncultured Psychrosphaera sp.]|uniref:DcaP family trimeric outer membrane transporter n=1 Tax=uncultured Psychrosphaera sp. TaxID=1403522 RepID=UPI002633EDF1|nr:DcaP family trimeric outer membrane transporter [uncultured Psychrosphaera sp.]
MFNISGMIKLDVIYDAGVTSGDRIDYTNITTDNPKGQVRIHARESRLNISTSQDILGKRYTTILEGDFYAGGSNSPVNSENISNASSFRLRHAYMSYGQWLAGQTWSNYVDVKSFPETLDFSNDTGQSFIRQGQIRYSHSTEHLIFSYSIENPETDVDFTETGLDSTDAKSDPSIDPIFDFTAKAKYQSAWGHLSLQNVLRKHKVQTDSNSLSEIGYGLGVSGKTQLTPQDLIKFHYSQGIGIGRYIQEAAGAAGILTQSLSATHSEFDLMLLEAKGGYLSYQHTFNETLRVNMSSGFMDIDYPSMDTQNAFNSNTKTLTSFHSNIIWSVTPHMEAGIEYSQVNLIKVSGAQGNIKRFQLSTKIRF